MTGRSRFKLATGDDFVSGPGGPPSAEPMRRAALGQKDARPIL